eukprot:TRINITY_DN8896_c3_g1_i1.p1 TRINITY_DN8896_c3_g1~~TRINITY_DN8896_c3_g1_i1.p1  ORF type:complete len:190 (-),score=42.51 TRINITY_DN8896_c3_g1_i1:194-763(-)
MTRMDAAMPRRFAGGAMAAMRGLVQAGRQGFGLPSRLRRLAGKRKTSRRKGAVVPVDTNFLDLQGPLPEAFTLANEAIAQSWFASEDDGSSAHASDSDSEMMEDSFSFGDFDFDASFDNHDARSIDLLLRARDETHCDSELEGFEPVSDSEGSWAETYSRSSSKVSHTAAFGEDTSSELEEEEEDIVEE